MTYLDFKVILSVTDCIDRLRIAETSANKERLNTDNECCFDTIHRILIPNAHDQSTATFFLPPVLHSQF